MLIPRRFAAPLVALLLAGPGSVAAGAAQEKPQKKEPCPPSATAPPAPGVERKTKPLAPEELADLERQVRAKCGVRGDSPDGFLPWYYHYTLGLELHKRGDEEKALDCLKSAVHRRPEPKAGARVYGLWFVDYFPYSVLADVNERLGYLDCAADARRLAEALETPRKR